MSSFYSATAKQRGKLNASTHQMALDNQMKANLEKVKKYNQSENEKYEQHKNTQHQTDTSILIDDIKKNLEEWTETMKREFPFLDDTTEQMIGDDEIELH